MDHDQFNAFWKETLDELASVPMDAEVEMADDEGIMHEAVKTFQNYSVRLSSFEGHKLRGWYTTPIGEPPAGGFPALITAPGYFGIQSLSTHYVRHGYCVFALYPRGQGESVVEWELPHSTKATYHIEDRYKYYYRGAYADLVRGVDFLCQCPEVDKNRIGTWGMSQGGGFALAIAGLDRRIKAASAEVAWPCNFEKSVEIEEFVYGEFYRLFKDQPDKKEQYMETLAYFDTYNLAKNITCPTLMNAVIIDEVHPYRTIMPVFEQIPAKKSIIVYPDIEHGTRADFARHTLDWLDRYCR